MKKLLETFGEHGKDGKHQPDDLKRFIYDSKCSICDSKHFFWQPDASKHYSTMWTVKKSYHTRLENLILGQLKIGKHQAKFKALLNTYKGSEWNLKSTQITFNVPMYPAVCVGHI